MEGRRYRHDEPGIRALCVRLVRLRVALDLFDEPASRAGRRPLAGEAALGRLGAVAAARDEPPARPIARGLGVDPGPAAGGV